MVVQPLGGQLANIFGRRWPMILSVTILIIGSAICGWAVNGAMLIAGRALQGLGGGGISLLVELIVCDLVPLRDRSKFLGIILGSITVGTAVGPFIGGIIVQGTSWRVCHIFLQFQYQFAKVDKSLVGVLAKLHRRPCLGASRPVSPSQLHERIISDQ